MSLSLADLISPLSTQEFFSEYWEKKPLRLSRGEPGFYGDVLTLSDVDSLLASGHLQYPAIRLVRDGEELDRRSYLETVPWGSSAFADVAIPEAVFQHFAEGATIILQALHRRWPPLRNLTRSLESELTFRCQTNIYFTPKGSQGFAAHYDTHEVFVLQVSGSKVWRIYDAPHHLPLGNQKGRDIDIAQLQEEATLRAGDLLYLPRGFVHEALTADDDSLHITLGLPTVTWQDLIHAVLSQLKEQPALRSSLPVGYATLDDFSEVAEMAERKISTAMLAVDWSKVVEDTALKFITRCQLPLEGQLAQLKAAQTISGESKVKMRPFITSRLRREGERVHLHFSRKCVTFPSFIEPALNRLLTGDAYNLSDLEPDLDESGRLVLARRLIAEGFLLVLSPAKPQVVENSSQNNTDAALSARW